MVAMRRAQPLREREQSDEEEPHRGHARADDADVDLNGRPEAHVEEVPCWIPDVGSELDQRSEAEDADNGDTGRQEDEILALFAVSPFGAWALDM